MSRKKKKRSLESALIDSLLDTEPSEISLVEDVSAESQKDEALAGEATVLSMSAEPTVVEPSIDPSDEATEVQAGEEAKTEVISEAVPTWNTTLGEEEKTMQVGDMSVSPLSATATEAAPAEESTFLLSREATQRFTPAEMPGESVASAKEEIKFGRVTSDKMISSSGGGSSLELGLAQSENLRVAQNRILSLEDEIERIRQENEQLIAAGETIRRKSDDLRTRVEKSETTLREEKAIFNSEKRIYQESLQDKDKENQRMREKVEELEIRLESDLKKIRVRERELENRLELVKMEEAALLRNKDEIILDLKRKIDQLNSELENYRGRSLELHKNMEVDQEKQRRTVRALRLALTMLEDGGVEADFLKKAE